MIKPLIIQCCVVGAELTREIYPYLPLSPEEIAESAIGAVKAGAVVIHLHVRDEKGVPSQRADLFREATSRIRDRVECIIQYTTGAAVGTPIEERIGPLMLKPDMATLNMGSMNFGEDIFENKLETIRIIAKAIQANGVVPELEIFDHGMLDTAFRFAKQKIIPEKFHCGMGFGVPGGMGGDVQNLVTLAKRLEDHVWTASGIGRSHLSISAHAIALGGNVRVGLEDNIYFRKGEYAQSNSHLVERIVRLAEILERPVATVKEAKKILNIE
jgi:3-keto-5-aminohexanoate cleavage enzyme